MLLFQPLCCSDTHPPRVGGPSRVGGGGFASPKIGSQKIKKGISIDFDLFRPDLLGLSRPSKEARRHPHRRRMGGPGLLQHPGLLTGGMRGPRQSQFPTSTPEFTILGHFFLKYSLAIDFFLKYSTNKVSHKEGPTRGTRFPPLG